MKSLPSRLFLALVFASLVCGQVFANDCVNNELDEVHPGHAVEIKTEVLVSPFLKSDPIYPHGSSTLSFIGKQWEKLKVGNICQSGRLKDLVFHTKAPSRLDARTTSAELSEGRLKFPDKRRRFSSYAFGANLLMGAFVAIRSVFEYDGQLVGQEVHFSMCRGVNPSFPKDVLLDDDKKKPVKMRMNNATVRYRRYSFIDDITFGDFAFEVPELGSLSLNVGALPGSF